MRYLFKILIVLFLAALAVLFFRTQTEREYVAFFPMEGQVNSIKLLAENDYRQEIPSTRHNIKELSLYIREAIPNPLRKGELGVLVKEDGEVLAREKINVEFVDNNDPLKVVFDKEVKLGEVSNLSVELSVPKKLSGHYRIQLGEGDDNSDFPLFVNGERQDGRLALTASYSYRPPIAYQLGVLLAVFSLLLLFNISLRTVIGFGVYTVGLTVAYVLPAVLVGDFSVYLLLSFLPAFTGMYLLLGKLKFELPARLLGAHAFAFTTYFPLHLSAERWKLLLFAFLPFLFLYIYPDLSRLKKNYKAAVVFVVMIITLAIVVPYRAPEVSPVPAAHWRDIFLDPNQISTTEKFGSDYYALQIPEGDPDTIDYYGGWDNFGSYVGFINMVLAGIGLLYAGMKHWRIVAFGLIAFLMAGTSLLTPRLAGIIPFPSQYLIVMTTFSLAFLASAGLSALWSFLHKDRVTTFIIYAILAVTLIDMFNVINKTLQFGAI